MFTFVETPLFTRLVGGYLSDEEYRALQAVLMRDPSAGTVIPGSGGVRKLRWRTGARGKRGGVRVIYFRTVELSLIWMLTIHAKNEAAAIPASVLRRIRRELEND
ncbi:MAG TPA: transcriptional regulator [Candidatus Eisenbacteria bacterium]